MLEGLLALIIVLCIIGVVLYLVTTVFPMPPMYRNVVVAIVCLLVLIWFLAVVTGSTPGGLRLLR